MMMMRVLSSGECVIFLVCIVAGQEKKRDTGGKKLRHPAFANLHPLCSIPRWYAAYHRITTNTFISIVLK